MLRLTYGQVKSTVALQISASTTDTRCADACNEAMERLLEMGKWVGTYGRYRICVNAACLTWPRELETIEAVALCSSPGTVRNQWYEFLGNGPGILDEDSGVGVQLIDQGEHCAFDDVKGTDKRLAVYCDKTEAVSARIIIEFYDASGQFVRSQFGGEWINGESLALPAAGTYNYTTNQCRAGGLVRVIKPKTNGYVRLYEHNTLTGADKPLGYYAPDEEIPVYRRSLIPCLTESGGDCGNTTVDVMAKLRFIPVEKDNDMCLISSKSAIKLGCKALAHENANQYKEAAIAWGAARQKLEQQLEHHMGHGAVQPIRYESSEIFGGGVGNVI